MKELPSALHALSAVNQFVLWKAVPSTKRAGKIDKFPTSVDGKVIDAHDSTHWLSASDAIKACQTLAGDYGIGFVFTSRDPFFCIDIDGAYSADGWSPLSTQLCAMFPNAAVEVSHSGKGLHIIGSYSGDEPDHGCKNIPLGVELYTSGRFIALTGNGARGNAEDVNDLSNVITQYFSPSNDTDRPSMEWTTTHVADAYPIEDDNKLIEKALGTESKFGFSASFADLWNANTEALSSHWPDDDGKRSYDASSADAALAQHLCWWTGNNCERTERLMRISALKRDKWDYHKSYMERTIRSAASRTKSWYDKGAPVEVQESDEELFKLRDGSTVMPTTQQQEHFKGCVYVSSVHRVFIPNGRLLKPEQFNAMFGGYSFSQDQQSEKTVKKAFEAFTESQATFFPKADSMCFRPDLPSGEIVTVEGERRVNVYVDLNIPTSNADVTPFLSHLEKLLPVERDRTILLSFMAACIQHKGYKIQWAPLIQGVEGNGKTLFTRCVKYAVGNRYSHMPKAAKIDSEFNGWLLNKLFIGVEDIYVPENRREVIETLKPMITGGDGLEIQMKGVDQVTEEICANFILNSNHKDAIRTTLKDRRYCVFYTAQQEAADLKRDGMTGDYFEKLYQWLRDGGYAAVAGYLERYDIPAEFNPTGVCQRAPETSSTLEAVSLSLGNVEQEIMDAIEEGLQGFRGGWVSSVALDNLIEKMRKSNMIPKNKRLELMRSLGYDYHPHLKGGRVNNGTMVDNGRKPRLYIKDGHINRNIESPADVARKYEADNGNVLEAAKLKEGVQA